jgi:phosphoglycolate phosphatase
VKTTKYNTFIFDFDFTLADATPGIVESVNYALAQAGFEAKDRDSIRKTVGMTLRETFYRLTGTLEEGAAEQFVSDFMDMADRVMADNTVLFDDTIAILEKLKLDGCNTAIVTSKLHRRIDEVLSNYGISDMIDYIVGFEDVDTAKPSPEGVLKAVDHFGVSKQSVLYIGDTLIDAATAAGASVDFAAVVTGTTAEQEFSGFPHICVSRSLTELMNSRQLFELRS